MPTPLISFYEWLIDNNSIPIRQLPPLSLNLFKERTLKETRGILTLKKKPVNETHPHPITCEDLLELFEKAPTPNMNDPASPYRLVFEYLIQHPEFTKISHSSLSHLAQIFLELIHLSPQKNRLEFSNLVDVSKINMSLFFAATTPKYFDLIPNFFLVMTTANRPQRHMICMVLETAARRGYVTTVNALLAITTDNKPTQQAINAALAAAAQNGHLEVVQILAKKADSTSTALEKATHGGHLKIVNALLALTTDNKPTQQAIDAALAAAAQNGHLTIFQILAKTADSISTAAEKAAQNGHLEILEICLKIMAKRPQSTVENCQDELKTLLIIAARGGHPKIVEFLLTQIVVKDKKSIIDDALIVFAHNFDHRDLIGIKTLLEITAVHQPTKTAVEEALISTISYRNSQPLQTALLTTTASNKPSQEAVDGMLLIIVMQISLQNRLTEAEKNDKEILQERIETGLKKLRGSIRTTSEESIFGKMLNSLIVMCQNKRTTTSMQLVQYQHLNLQLIQTLLAMKGDNKPSQAIIDKILTIVTEQNNLEIIQALMAMTGDNHPSQTAVDEALEIATQYHNHNPDLIQMLLSMTKDNKPSQTVIDNLLKKDVERGHLEGVQLFLAMTGDNKPSQTAVDDALKIATRDNHCALIQPFLSMTGDNQPTPTALANAMKAVIDHQNFVNLPFFLSMKGANQPNLLIIINAALIEAASHGQVWIVQTLLPIMMREDNAAYHEAIHTAFIQASSNKHSNVLQVLETVIKDKSYQATMHHALAIAAQQGNLARIQNLLAVMEQDGASQVAVIAALQMAINNRHLPVVQTFLAITGDNRPNDYEQIESALCLAFNEPTIIKDLLHLELVKECFRMGNLKPENRPLLAKNLSKFLNTDVKKLLLVAAWTGDFDLLHACLSVIPPKTLCNNLLEQDKKNLTPLHIISHVTCQAPEVTSEQSAAEASEKKVSNPSLLLYQMYQASSGQEQLAAQSFIKRCLTLLAQEVKHAEAWMALAIIAHQEGNIADLNTSKQKIQRGAHPQKAGMFRPTPDPICQSFVHDTPPPKKQRDVTAFMMALTKEIRCVFPVVLSANFDDQPDNLDDHPDNEDSLFPI